MRVLFSMRHLGSLRLYESVLRRLAAAGHDVHVLASRRDPLAGATPEALLADVPGIRWSWSDDIRPNSWMELATAVRIWLDYLRYFELAYADAPRLRLRAAERVPALLRRITDSPFVRVSGGRRLLAAALRVVERALPRQEAVDALIDEQAPDVVLLTPLLHLGSPQIEVLRSARSRGVRTALCVGSWDHLSSKSLIRELPDRIFVWNETQKREALELHGVPAERVAVTGAQCFDQWFARTPVRSREEFCAQVGLPGDRPLLLWVCSALFVGSPSEARFVRRWIEEIRSSDDPVLRSAAILVRPHPARIDEWAEVDLSDLPHVARYGSMPIDEHAKEDYFESLHYSAAVAGLNTSAFLEAGIAGRPVHTILLPEFRENQEGTIHFHYLTTVGGGLLRVARTFDEHRAQLAASLRERPDPARHAVFVREFVRPHGLDRAATETFVQAVEAFGLTPAPRPAHAPVWAPAVRAALRPLAALARTGVLHGGDRTSFELQRARQKAQHRQQREADEQRLKAQREAERREKTAAADAARTAAVRERQERIAASERQKQELKASRQREKRQQSRLKRRAELKALLKRRLGFGGTHAR